MVPGTHAHGKLELKLIFYAWLVNVHVIFRSKDLTKPFWNIFSNIWKVPFVPTGNLYLQFGFSESDGVCVKALPAMSKDPLALFHHQLHLHPSAPFVSALFHEDASAKVTIDCAFLTSPHFFFFSSPLCTLWVHAPLRRWSEELGFDDIWSIFMSWR